MSWLLKVFLAVCVVNFLVICFYVFQEKSSVKIFKIAKPKIAKPKPKPKHQLSINRYKLVKYTRPKEAKKLNILLWTTQKSDRNWAYQDRKTFTKGNCLFTHDKNYLDHVYEYDAIVFNAFKNKIHGTYKVLPTHRSEHQIYILYARE